MSVAAGGTRQPDVLERLLNVVGDPETYKKHLQELAEVERRVDGKEKALRETIAEAEKSLASAEAGEKTLAQQKALFEEQKAQQMATVGQIEARLEGKEKALGEREQAVAASEAKAKNAQAEADRQVSGLRQMQEQLGEKEKVVAQALMDAEAEGKKVEEYKAKVLVWAEGIEKAHTVALVGRPEL